MSTYVSGSGEIIIPASKLGLAAAALRAACPNIKGNTLKELFEFMDFNFSDLSSGDICADHYDGIVNFEFETAFKAIAPYVEPGGCFEWEAEDGRKYRDSFDGKTCLSEEAHLIYGPTPVLVLDGSRTELLVQVLGGVLNQSGIPMPFDHQLAKTLLDEATLAAIAYGG